MDGNERNSCIRDRSEELFSKIHPLLHFFSWKHFENLTLNSFWEKEKSVTWGVRVGTKVLGYNPVVKCPSCSSGSMKSEVSRRLLIAHAISAVLLAQYSIDSWR